MTVEFIIAHSKYKVGKDWENCLTYKAKSTGAVSGTYTYYHNGEKVWEEFDTEDLFNDLGDGTIEAKRRECGFEYNRETGCEKAFDDYPVYIKYCNDCQKFALEELGL